MSSSSDDQANVRRAVEGVRSDLNVTTGAAGTTMRNASHAAFHPRSFQHWDHANWHQVALARKESHGADQVLSKADLEVRKVSQERLKAQGNSQRQLELRVHRLVFWKREIERALGECAEQQTGLERELEWVREASRNLEEPRRINADCTSRRQQRQAEDLVEDEVDRRLGAEATVLARSAGTLEELRGAVEEQLRMCRKHIYKLTKDLKLKEEALSTDEECIVKEASRKSEAVDALHTPHAPNLTTASPPPPREFRDASLWEQKNGVEVERARVEVHNCVRMCSKGRLTRKCVREDVMRSLLATDQSLRNRCNQTASALAILEEQLANTVEQINRISIKLNEINGRIDDQIPQENTAKQRIKARVEHRPKRERCFDGAQATLIQEVDLLTSSARSLAEIKALLQKKLRDLQSRKEDLDARLAVKKNSADIDEDFCISQRKNLKYDNFVA